MSECLRWLYHHVSVSYIFRESWVLFLLSLCSVVMCANNRIHYDPIQAQLNLTFKRHPLCTLLAAGIANLSVVNAQLSNSVILDMFMALNIPVSAPHFVDDVEKVDCCVPPLGLLWHWGFVVSPHSFAGTWPQLSPDLFSPTPASISWCRLCDKCFLAIILSWKQGLHKDDIIIYCPN